jgi:hypothetical protein
VNAAWRSGEVSRKTPISTETHKPDLFQKAMRRKGAAGVAVWEILEGRDVFFMGWYR